MLALEEAAADHEVPFLRGGVNILNNYYHQLSHKAKMDLQENVPDLVVEKDTLPNPRRTTRKSPSHSVEAAVWTGHSSIPTSDPERIPRRPKRKVNYATLNSTFKKVQKNGRRIPRIILKGVEHIALPDSGSDKNIISSQFASDSKIKVRKEKMIRGCLSWVMARASSRSAALI
jgi:hypothetical protein